ncbi:hypothetical protein BDF20DRAFT_400615 [Mycotypha africana]|uniref:uncharacterized protein n=1 Tax=Mycotypha africana TaxID=64632 RepID=UPI00230108BC|nr:uncharacterized protein BDF20DRAFT_400615 [Mycotypha africana]KAI8984638.1 hypothetical protein BDF20DRAFT_400615 [Mycotypha africana]
MCVMMLVCVLQSGFCVLGELDLFYFLTLNSVQRPVGCQKDWLRLSELSRVSKDAVPHCLSLDRDLPYDAVCCCLTIPT